MNLEKLAKKTYELIKEVDQKIDYLITRKDFYTYEYSDY